MSQQPPRVPLPDPADPGGGRDGARAVPDTGDEARFREGARRALARRGRGPGRATAMLAGLRGHWPWLLGIGLALAALGLVLLREPLADALWPEARAQALETQAALALSQGRLSAGDGSGARELYEAALAIDPDRDEAHRGLVRVAEVALAQAARASAQDRFADAHRHLHLARALAVPRERADAVAARLRERETIHAGVDALLQRAGAARARGHFAGADDAALPLYQRVLELQPQRTEALEGREDALAELLQQAQAALARGELAHPAEAVATARRFDPGHGDLPGVQANLARAIDEARQRADGALRAGRLERAAQGYRQLLEIDGNDLVATEGLQRVGLAHAARAERAAADFRFAEADAALRQARVLAPGSAAVATAERHLERARTSQGRLQPLQPSRQRTRQVATLLAEAAAAEARGDLLAPPGDSAYDKVRAARALAPGSAAVQRASARLLPAARACFEAELRGNQLARARACLDTLAVLEGGESTLGPSRRRLAQRWLAVGDERLGAGEVARAGSALAAARELDPGVPGLEAFAQRVRAASAGRP